MPRVSVLMPVRNGERFLLDAVGSILQQTFTDLELVIVDDASTDGTSAILQDLADPRVRVLHLESAMGPSAARNAAFDHSRGDLVALLDSDDRSAPCRLERQVEFLTSHTAHVLVGSSFRLINDVGADIGWSPVLLDDLELRRDVFTRNPFANSAVLVQRDALARAGGWDDRLRVGEDYDLWVRVLEHGKVANIAEALSDYRLHGAQTSVPDQLAQAASIRERLWVAYDPPGLSVGEFREARRRYSDTAPEVWPHYVDRHLALIAEAGRRRRGRWLGRHVYVATLLLAERARRAKAVSSSPSS